jgi:ADP-ribose pyrophosphatase YjhB (NUDIX family)
MLKGINPMLRNELIQAISDYKEFVLPALAQHPCFSLEEEEETLKRFSQFIESTPHCFNRENSDGHVTGSAFVINDTQEKVVLTHHKKLGIWLQLGGHADGDHQIDQVALRETREESGLSELSFISPAPLSNPPYPLPIDFDIHLIQARKNEPKHYHYDVRYLVRAADNKLQISDESNDLQWFELNQARKLNTERSMLRPFDKISSIIT